MFTKTLFNNIRTYFKKLIRFQRGKSFLNFIYRNF